MVWLPDVKFFEDMFIRFNRIHERDGRIDTARRHRPRLCIASRGKNSLKHGYTGTKILFYISLRNTITREYRDK